MNFKFQFLGIQIIANINRIKEKIHRFVDLAPVDNADLNGNYAEAINYALTNNKIKNIAITGPYGAGKSSIIKTYEKNSALKFLNISLAAFKDDDEESKTNKQDQNILIERSILQQMLYGSDANKLPYSRFKRIATPVTPLLKSFIFIFWGILAFILYNYNLHLPIPSWGDDLFVFYYFLVIISLSIPVVILSDIYKATFLISFKKVSLSNAEFETGDVSESSILNRHLDEIIYFFQSTNYDVVVIEDLDRFQSPEIFVKLREINKLVNDSEKTSGNIKFIYALKDDMFAHKNRAKFFDFIIPVVPIINSSNSLDKMRERILKESLSNEISSQFLREVSWYVDDLRLIHNIFNEFIIYNDILNSRKINATKLLAMMIYKNVYPEDFESLHHGDGALYLISHKRAELIELSRKKINSKILESTSEIKKYNDELLTNIEDLIKLFIGHIVSSTGINNLNAIKCNGAILSFSGLNNWESFESLFNQNQLIVLQQGYYNNSEHNLGKSFAQIEAEISPNESFAKRKINIEKKASDRIARLEQSIIQMESEKSALSQLPLHKLLQDDSQIIDSIILKTKLKDPRLLVYLVKNGYLDETYHLYTSNFHEGRMTKNDRDFLLAIRDFKKPDPSQIIDTPNEVFENMRAEDFSHKYVLNATLMDYLFSDSVKHATQINSAIEYISKNFPETEEFFSTYWSTGRQISAFTSTLATNWPLYIAAALKTAKAPSHVALLLNHVSSSKIIESLNIDGILTQYISEFSTNVFSSNYLVSQNYDSLKDLNIKVKSLDLLSTNTSLIEFLYLNNLYEINTSNVLFLMEKYSSINSKHKYESQNYSSLSEPGCEILKKYVDSKLQKYISDVFLILPNNTRESFDTIFLLLKNTKISMDLRRDIITRQDFIFESLGAIPKELWRHAISEDKVKPSWDAIINYLELSDSEDDFLTEKIQTKNWFDALITSPISKLTIDEQQKKKISKFILENDNLSITSYTGFTNNLPYWYHDFPDVSDDKKTSLAKYKVVRLTEKSFSSSESDNSLRATLIEKSPSEYFSSREQYPLDGSVKALLLVSNLDTSQKFEICKDIELSEIDVNKNLAKLASGILALDGVDCEKMDYAIVSKIIEYSESMIIAIQILNKCVYALTEKQVMNTLSQLPEPYCEIASYGKRPKLERTILNEIFAGALKSRGFISSVRNDEEIIQINTFKSVDHAEGANE